MLGFWFLLIVTFVAAGVILAGGLALSLVFFFFWKPRRWWKWTPLILAGLIAPFVALSPFLVFFIGDLTPASAQLEEVYPDAPSSIKIVHAKGSSGWDSDEIFLALRASPTDRAFLMSPAQGFGPDDPDSAHLVDKHPEWYRAMSCKNRYVRASSKVSTWQDTVVTYCPDDGITYVHAATIE